MEAETKMILVCMVLTSDLLAPEAGTSASDCSHCYNLLFSKYEKTGRQKELQAPKAYCRKICQFNFIKNQMFTPKLHKTITVL